MGLHKVKIIYPGYKSFEFKQFSNGDWDYFWQTLKAEWRSNSSSACAMFKDANIRSFGINDFIQVDNTFYRCMCPGGMVEVSEKFVNEIEDKIRNHYLVQERDEYFWAKLEVFEELEKNNNKVSNKLKYEHAKV